jgi:glycolate oxidase FAD binding subunit
MSDRLTPRDAKDVEAAVQWALGNGKALEVAGAGTKRGIGRPSQTDLTLDLSRLSGVTLYEPEELVLSARAGTPLAEIEALVADKGQMLAFEPMDYGPLLGQPPGAGTIGGALAANLSGPRRIRAGAARDHFLGVSAVSGRGETFKSGGRVVKNVTGYDLCKLLAGSWGTLAVMTDVTIKVLPRAETEETLLVLGLDPPRAVAAMTTAMRSACDVSGAAHLPLSQLGRDAGLERIDASLTALRLEGVAPSVAHRRRMLESLMQPFGQLTVLPLPSSAALWRSIRDAIPFAQSTTGTDRAVWRVSTAPAKGAELGTRIATETGADVRYDWAGGLLWVLVPAAGDAGARSVRAAVAACGGHATLIRAPLAVRSALDIFEPQDGGLAAVTRRVKESFDPSGVLNRGRMYAGI